MKSPADIAEAHTFLEAHPDIEAIELLITDPSGVARGKLIAREELISLYTDGRCVAGSILGLDVTGEDVEETGLVWSVGDADRLCWPVPGTLRRVPWTQRPSAQVLLTMFDMDGTPTYADPRHALARTIHALEPFKPVVAAEIEFYLLARRDGQLVPASGLLSGRAQNRFDSYGVSKLDDMSPVFDDIYGAAKLQSLPLRTLMSEYAPGQFEITLLHRAGALQAIDEAIAFKRLIRGVALRHGLIACFMAKPFEQHAGSGMHLHVSLQDSAGENVFANDDPAGTPLLRHAIGGLRATMAESMLIFAPNANSYRRFRRMSYAPVAPTWGINNRSVSLRVPAGNPASRHVEHRVSGADANPYLVAATVLAGVKKGLDERLDPGPPVTGNGYQSNQESVLARDWHSAIRAAQESHFLRRSLGERFMHAFLAIKQQEYDRFNAKVTNADYEWYLDS
ncbi:MAG: glutamine synthetase family protein [Povalibacter sp.]